MCQHHIHDLAIEGFDTQWHQRALILDRKCVIYRFLQTFGGSDGIEIILRQAGGVDPADDTLVGCTF